MSVIQKLKLKVEETLWLIQCPENCRQLFNGMTVETALAGKGAINQLVFFALNKKELNKTFPEIIDRINDPTVCWIAYPKKSSGISSDLLRDEGWEIIGRSDFQFVSSVAIDGDWTGMRIGKRKPGGEYKRDIPMEERMTPGIDYINRTVVLPGDALKALSEFEGLEAFFYNMSFSHKKENVEAIEEAKKPETRQRRIDKMILILLKMKAEKEAKQKR